MNDDTISRQAAIDVLRRKMDKTAKGEIGAFYNTIIRQDIECIEQLPSAERRGRWEKDNDTAFFWKCSECGAYLFWRKEEYLLRDTDEPNYCPNCGAQMSPPDEE